MTTDPLWYKDAIIYQLHVRAFQDSIADGVGDFRGLTKRLDYLQDLGITTIWILPFYPSPLRDDGYDIASYTEVNPQYGTLRDFREFLDAAHRHGLKVITELVLNHTSDQHPWFQRARLAPKGSVERDFYVWSDAPDKYLDARIIFKDFERSNWTYDAVADAYFWHRFYSHQPDLNFDNPAVWDALTPIIDFWFNMGVDGMRLDAIPYLYEREGTNCENLPETHVFLKHIRKHVDEKFPNRMFLAEANQWPEDAIPYFGDGDECHMAFHFPLMPRLYMALHQEDRFPILDILEQTPAIPENCQWCIFLRNHDELTLEMVTDEERDYMYRAYAHDPQARINLGIRRRLAPLLRNDRRRMELMNALLFSMPGTPVVYYGDEIGMGDNIYLGDRNGVRTPMQWSADRNAGFSRANPQKLFLPIIIDPEYHYEAVNVDAQQSNSSSLLWWMKRLIALRKQFQAFGRGSITFLRPENPKILAFVRKYQEETILVVANLSRFVQYVELDLSEFKGTVPMELFGRTPFPRIGELPYLLTIGPHGFYWFNLSAQTVSHATIQERPRERPAPIIGVKSHWQELLEPSHYFRLEDVLVAYLSDTLVEHGRHLMVRQIEIRVASLLPFATVPSVLLLFDCELANGDSHYRSLPIGFTSEEVPSDSRQTIATIYRGEERLGVLYDARNNVEFCSAVLRAVGTNGEYSLDEGELMARSYPPFAEYVPNNEVPLPLTTHRGEQNNLSVCFGGKVVMKTFERLQPGANPDLELGRFLTEHTTYNRAAPVIGSIEFRPRDANPLTLSVLFGYVPNECDGWQFTLDALSRFYESVLTSSLEPSLPAESLLFAHTEGDVSPPPQTAELMNSYLHIADQLGRNTAEMHRALASGNHIPQLAPEPFNKLYQRSIYQSMRTTTGIVFRDLARMMDVFPKETQELAKRLLSVEPDLLHRYRNVLGSNVDGYRIRCHGDYHLGQLLFTGTDFMVIDFEGDPHRPLTERRIKRSPLRDVANMIRSFHYAAFSPLFGVESGRGTLPGHVREADRTLLRKWARYWASWVSVRFARSYFTDMASTNLLPTHPEVCREMLTLMVIEKAISELGFEMAHRPEWIPLPLTGLVEVLCPMDAPTVA